MGERIRACDWAKTPVGPPGQWPQSLRSAVSILLPSKAQIVLFWGRDDLLTFYNDAYRPVFGAKHPNVLGMPAREAWSEIWESGLRELFEGVLTTGDAYWAADRLFVLKRHDFLEETFFDVSYDPVRDESGQVNGIFCIVNEKTARVLSERRLQALRDLSEGTAGTRSAEEAMAAAAAILGDENLDVPFSLLYRLAADGRRAVLAGASGVARATAASPETIDLGGLAVPWPLRAVQESGEAVELCDLEGRFGPLSGGPWPEPPQRAVVLPLEKAGQERLAGFLVAGVSPRLPYDDEYRGFFDLLAGCVTAAVANAQAYEEETKRAEALAELDRAKTAFFSNLSHEFRTPLTLMLGPVEDLLAHRDADLSPAANDQLELVHRNGLRLVRLVNTLLDFSRIEAGRVRATFEATDLAPFTAELAGVFRAAIERAGLELVVDCPPLSQAVHVDREMWEKIVLNLLSNAFKFTFEGTITVRLHQEGDHVRLEVSDTGTGIASEEVPRLFERFHRIHNARSRTHEGSGIGLALVQELVRLHGGTIAATSMPGQGTTFRITMPLGTAHLPTDQLGPAPASARAGKGASPFVEEALRWLPESQEEGGADERLAYADVLPVPATFAGSDAVAEAPAGDGQRRVLVVDDNADMRRYLVRVLSGTYEVDTAPDGIAAREAAQAHVPDLVLSDVMMPRLDGFGLLRDLRGDARTKDVPVILLSARAGEESRVEGLKAGADDYLIKPFSARELLARVSAHLQMSRLRRQAAEEVRRRGEQFQTLLEQAPLGVYLVDADLRMREANPVTREVLGDLPGGIMGRDLGELMQQVWEKPYADEIVRLFRETLTTGKPYVAPERSERRRDRGTIEYYEWRIDRINLPDGGYGVVCYFRDVSQQVLTRKAIEESREALRDADRRKDEFLATLAHELRGPLAPLRNSLEIMRLSDDGDLQAKARGTMERQLGTLIRLVDDLLDVSRITSNKLELRMETADLGAVLREAVETCRPFSETLGHEVILDLPDEPIPLHADPVRLVQVFQNLVHNACKYTDRGGRSEVALVCRSEA